MELPEEPNSTAAEQPIDYWGIFKAIWIKRSLITKIVAGVTILTIGVSLLLSNKYRSTAIVLPDSEGSKLGGLGGLADLASMAGVSVGGGKSWNELYPQIILSDAVLHDVIYKKYHSEDFKDSVTLIEYFEFDNKDPQKNYDKTYENLTKMLEVNADKKTRVLTVSLVLYESQLAADIVNTILQRMDEFIRTKRISNASERRKWIDQRLTDVKSDLSKAENNLKDFRERNRVISNSPQLLLEQQRLIREVEINSTVFIELKKQLELAKIDEINTMPIINILDAARYTTIKESPKRSVIVIVMFLLALSASAGYVIVDHHYHKQIEEFRKKMRELRNSPGTA